MNCAAKMQIIRDTHSVAGKYRLNTNQQLPKHIKQCNLDRLPKTALKLRLGNDTIDVVDAVRVLGVHY